MPRTPVNDVRASGAQRIKSSGTAGPADDFQSLAVIDADGVVSQVGNQGSNRFQVYGDGRLWLPIQGTTPTTLTPGQFFIETVSGTDQWAFVDSFGVIQYISSTIGGADKEVQFNDGGVFGGDPAFTFDKLLQRVTITSAGSVAQLQLVRTATATGSVFVGAAGDRNTSNTYELLSIANSTLSGSLQVQLYDAGNINFVGTGVFTLFNFGAQVSTIPGTAAAPGLAVASNDLDTGIYRVGANNLGVTCGGLQMLQVGGNGLLTGDGVTAADRVNIISTPAGQNRLVVFRTGSLNRWYCGADSTAEAGADAGSNWVHRAWNDAGVFIDEPLNIVRAAGGALTIIRPTAITVTATTGTPSRDLIVTPGAHTALTASTEYVSVSVNSQTQTFATGSFARNRYTVIGAPTYAFVGASTITNAGTFVITGAPNAGTNATITNAYALWIESGASGFAGNIKYTSASTFQISAATSDGADTARAALCGGGDVMDSRGGLVQAFGNEEGTLPGLVRINAGDVAGNGTITFATAGTTCMTINRNGQLTMLAGSAALPSFSFTGDVDTGMYHPSTNQLGFSVGGGLAQLITSSEIQLSLQLLGSFGTAALPGFSFLGDSANGMYRAASNTIGFATNATLRLSISTTEVNTSVNITQTGSTSISTGTGSQLLNGETTVSTGTSTPMTINTSHGSPGLALRTTAVSSSANSGTYNFYAKSSAGADQLFGYIQYQSTGNTVGSEQSTLRIATIVNGVGFVNIVSAVGNAVTLNGHFVQTDSFAGDYVLKVSNSNATGLGLRIEAGADANSALAVRNAATTITFNVLGTGAVSAANGTAAAPAYGFVTTTDCGIYRGGTAILGFATSATQRMIITAAGSVVIGSAAIGTTATDGFLYIPTCAGTPTGVPTAYAGMAPMVIDSSNNKLYFYSGGSWRDAGP